MRVTTVGFVQPPWNCSEGTDTAIGGGRISELESLQHAEELCIVPHRPKEERTSGAKAGQVRAAGETRAGGQKEKEDTRWTQGLDRQDSAAAAIECPEEDDQKNTLAGRRRNKKAEDEAWERQGETAGAGRLRKVLQRLQEWVTQMGECGKNLKESGEGTLVDDGAGCEGTETGGESRSRSCAKKARRMRRCWSRP